MGERRDKDPASLLAAARTNAGKLVESLEKHAAELRRTAPGAMPPDGLAEGQRLLEAALTAGRRAQSALDATRP
jgi:hypothetical protein